MHAIWLTFSKNDRDYLKKIIDEISEKYNAPKFEPHITVYGLIDSEMRLIDSIAKEVILNCNSFLIKKSEIKESIIKKILEKSSSEKIKKLSEKKEVQVIQFEPKVCYSLNPEEFSDMCIGSDIDSTHLFQK